MLLKLLDLIGIFGQLALMAQAYMYMFRPKSRLAFFLVFAVGGGLLNLHFVFFETRSLVKMIVSAIFMMLVVHWFCRASWHLNFLAFGLITLFGMAGQMVVILILQAILGDRFEMAVAFGAPLSVTGRVFVMLVLALLYPILVMLWRHYVDKLSPPRLQMFVLVPASQMLAIAIMTYITSQVHQDRFYIVFAVFIFAFVLADVGFFYALRQTINHDQLAHENAWMQAQLKLQFAHYEQLAENADRLQKMRHDMINHLEAIRASIEVDQAGGQSVALLDRYAEELAATRLVNYSNNRVIDAVLVNKREMADKLGVSYEVQMNWPAKTPCDDLELCSIFGNLLDNAIAAASAIRVPGLAKQVRLHCYRSGGYLIVQCWNSKDQPIVTDTNGRIVSTKTDHTVPHGLGIRIVQDIVDKYEGEFRIGNSDRHFQVTLFLPDPESKASSA